MDVKTTVSGEAAVHTGTLCGEVSRQEWGEVKSSRSLTWDPSEGNTPETGRAVAALCAPGEVLSRLPWGQGLRGRVGAASRLDKQQGRRVAGTVPAQKVHGLSAAWGGGGGAAWPTRWESQRLGRDRSRIESHGCGCSLSVRLLIHSFFFFTVFQNSYKFSLLNSGTT